MSVKLVWFRAWAEAATARAALVAVKALSGGAASPSMVGSSSPMGSTRMQRCWVARSSVIPGGTAPTRRTMAASFGKMPTASARRLIPSLTRSSGFTACSLLRRWAGKPV